ncbi:MAG: CapA family protein [Clostridia bacterium]|nr:CapA family protein [Clostridia bacterium]
MKRALCLLALLLFVASSAAASGTWYTFPTDSPPGGLGFRITEASGTVTLTFLGDCTLGGESSTRKWTRGIFRRVQDNGYEYPFRGLTALTLTDDLTVANLECVLTDRDLPKTEKEFNFSGPSDYTGILTAGGVECVSVANNHSKDYGTQGYNDTRKALSSASVAYFGTDDLAVWESDDGLLIGFIGVSGGFTARSEKIYKAQAQALRDIGCHAVITVMHVGQEYSYTPNATQRRVAQTAAAEGSALVVGHHPHVVQGYEMIGDVPVVYSLGNCAFGGNANPQDYDAMALQADLTFEETELTGVRLRFYPISVSGSKTGNDYSPVLLSGSDAERVLEKMRKSTGYGFKPWNADTGAEATYEKQ